MSVRLTVDGREVEVPPGTTIGAACEAVGIEVPTLCFLEGMTPANACRVCVVELEGARVLVPACSRPVEPGMVIHTDSPRVRLARRVVLELLGSSVDLSLAPRALGYLSDTCARPERFGGGGVLPQTVAQPVKVDNDLYVRDLSRCILCYRCVDACGEEAQGTFAIAVAGRGFEARIATEHDRPLPDSACVYCGNCIGVCPTGALMPRTEHAMRSAGTWDESRQSVTETICPYCGVGCPLELTVQDNRIVKAGSPRSSSVSGGHLCIKGRFGWDFVQDDPG